MIHVVALVLFAAAGLGLVLVGLQVLVVRRHVAAPVAAFAGPRPPISILKPLCGLDDGLWESLALFADLDYPDYEVLLGVKSAADPAWGLACAAARRWPGRFRAIQQRGEPGLNPKVNQLLTLAREARHDLLVISDSNVRVDRGYLEEIAALLADEEVGLVTHPVVGVGEARLGSLFDHLHLAGAVAPGVVAAKRLAGRDVVVGKSMALRRADLVRMGGFEAVKDVLAEDFVLGVLVPDRLGKRVVLAPTPVRNVSERRTLADFAGRYRRWAVLQRQLVGPFLYAAQALLNPVLLAAGGLACARSGLAAAGFGGTCLLKAVLDGASARALRPSGFSAAQLALVPAKDLVFGAAWAYGLVRRDVLWRGTRLLVGKGTRIDPELVAEPSRGGAHGEAAGAPTPSFTI
jgi:ceramide glucosyltransferase